MSPSREIDQEEEACLDATVFSLSHVFPLVLRTAVELNLFEIIAKAGHGAHVSASEIASQLPTTNPDAPSVLDRILRLFATHSLLSYSSRTLDDGRIEKLYGLTPASKFFIGTVEEGNISPLYTFASHRVNLEVWLHMKDLILEGGNLFKKVHGMSLFEYTNKDPEFNTIFNQAMAGSSTLIMNGILAIYKGFEGLTSLVDVGGGTGRTLNMIISKYPSIRGINYDLPHVIQTAPPYPGLQHVGGNMLTSIPKGEAIMIKDTFHNWSDENVVKILKNIYEVLPNNGKLIVMNAVLPEEPETSKASQNVSAFDNMMLTIPSGKERTTREFEALIRAAGFINFKVACVGYGIWAVMESYK
ncbi:hypothetical protein P3X46_033963 [Hevea brasiliensis]|uniref:O-methyltransferase domain-containing protein n=1 Tax=Hevea brasiliensis TaxID=3981 RepID=A0ABQ9KBB1_HEVBR|nr:caffeic acid 3-O-methyltransferase-like [Hevea brasiliensis]KAJ9129233.1 hypothetical protein P3X46_033963 [Hevea brasiliensis]